MKRETKRLFGVVLGAALAAGIVASYSIAAAPPATHLPIQPVKKCGDPVIFKKADPDHILKTLPPFIQQWYYSYYAEIHASPWANWPGKKPPWKIGLINFPVDNPWQVAVMNTVKQQFALAKAKGLVKGSLQLYVQPDWATATPDQQIAALQSMVRSGVDAVILHPLNSVAQTKSFDDAGKAGVPVIMMANITPGGKYVVNDMTVNQVPGITDFLKMYSAMGWFKGDKTYNTVEVRGVQGNEYETTVHDTWVAATKPCKGIKLVGTVWGNWAPTTTKTEMLKFLSSYTGTIDFIEHGGAMQSGVIEAFESLGKTVPPMQMSGTTGGDLAWWCKHPEYKSIGYEFGGGHVGYTTFDIALRMLAGKGLKYRDLSFPALKITSSNTKATSVCRIATPGVDLTWVGDIRAPANGWVGGNPKNLDYFFKKPGSPLHGAKG